MSVRMALTALTTALLLLGQASAVHSALELPDAIEGPAGKSNQEQAGPIVGSGADLVRIVEKNLIGFRAYDLSFNGDGAAPSFDVKSYRGDKIWNTVVDATTRQIVRSAMVMSTSDLHGEDRRNIDDFKRSRMALSEAIAIAEKYGPGNAISAGLHHAGGRLVFVVVVVSNGELKEIVIRADRDKRGRRLDTENPVSDGALRAPA
ncbi:hypothetical protein HUU61_20665 [Rhodopseudomonas palustris]|nr:hypothetical protein [Rhodopseudomonas palustris]